MSQIKNQEGSYKKHLKDFLPLYNANDVRFELTGPPLVVLTTLSQASVQSLLATYPTLLQDLVPRRTEEIDAASTMRMSITHYSIDATLIISSCFSHVVP